MTNSSTPKHLILASGSKIRAEILQKAGLDFSIQPALVDEEALKEICQKDGLNPKATALKLAQAKSLAPRSNQFHQPHDNSGCEIVIGADQILEFQQKIVSKAKSESEAIERLSQLNGLTHNLHSAVAISLDGQIVWSHVETIGMTMRHLSPSEMIIYGQKAGRNLTQTVGGYAYEDVGIHLFDRIDGDYHALLGLPILPLLKALRHLGIGLV